MHRLTLILLACSFTTAFAAEHIFSFGIKGGVPLTDAFTDTTTRGVDVITHTFSNTKNYVIGPTVELSLPFGFAVEADALYRPLNLTTDITVVPAAAGALFPEHQFLGVSDSREISLPAHAHRQTICRGRPHFPACRLAGLVLVKLRFRYWRRYRL